MDADARQLLKLRRFAQADRRDRAAGDPPTLSFVADERERIGGVVCAQASVIAIVEGEKEVWRGGLSETFAAGAALVLPRGWTGDIVNVPDARSGFYRAVVLLFPDDSPAGRAGGDHGAAVIDEALGEALMRALEAVVAPGAPAAVAADHIDAVARLLAARGALDLSAASDAVAPRLRAMIRARPDSALTLAQAARRLSLSPATVKRRLAAEGTGFAALTTGERMALAGELITGGAGTLTEVAGACGYRSLSKFSRRFRAVTGRAPLSLRGGAA